MMFEDNQFTADIIKRLPPGFAEEQLRQVIHLYWILAPDDKKDANSVEAFFKLKVDDAFALIKKNGFDLEGSPMDPPPNE